MPEQSPEPDPEPSKPPSAPTLLPPDVALKDDRRFFNRVKRFLRGRPKDIQDQRLFHHLSLIPFLAWVGLGADGLSSSAYGPPDAFLYLGEHKFLAIALALMTGLTVVIISAAYSRIIEEFPHGGGGYVVATKSLGARLGVVSGSALLVDYILTITVSIAAAGEALFSLIPLEFHGAKLPSEIFFIVLLTTLNIRGVRESVVALAPIFVLFLLTHVLLIAGGIALKAPSMPETARAVGRDFSSGMQLLGLGGLLRLALHAYSLGGGTYTGIEAVSNGLQIMREPRVQTAKRTMIYMAVSLACTAAGLLLCYLLWGVDLAPGKTLNAVLAERFVGERPGGQVFVFATLLSEGALLVVAAQAGFLDGPRVLANMAVDSWIPRRFAALSERLTTENGIVLMGATSLAALLYTRGDVGHLVVMYSINVFLTFSLSMFGMARLWLKARRERGAWRRRFSLFAGGFLLCATILVITVVEKFAEGGWMTLLATGLLVLLCFAIKRHYRTVSEKLASLYSELGDLPVDKDAPLLPLASSKPTAAVLVAGYGGLGIHTALNIFRVFPGHFKNLIFLSVGVIDSGGFKGEGAIEALQHETEEMLKKYLELARGLRIPATYRYAVGTDAVSESEKLCMELVKEFPQTTFFAGKVIFQQEKWYQQLLHNETAHAIQKRLQWRGRTMVVMPARLR